MPIMPGVEWRPLPEVHTEPAIQVRGLLFHSIVGSVDAAWNKFRYSSTLESTFLVRWSGHIIQIQDTSRQADANYLGNAYYGSVETEDGGDPDRQPWSEEQLNACLRIARFYHEAHGVPLQLIPQHGGWGYGYHTLLGAPSPWTPVAKSCPGAIRKQQFHQVLLPRILGATIDDMPSEAFHRTETDRLIQALGRENSRNIQDRGSRLYRVNNTLKAILRATVADPNKADEIIAAIEADVNDG